MAFRKLRYYSIFRSPYFIRKFPSSRCCSTSINFLLPDEISNVGFKFNDARVSNLLSHFRNEFATGRTASREYSDFLSRLAATENQLADVDRQIEELEKNFPDCPPAVDRPTKEFDADFGISTSDSELAKLVDDDRKNLSEQRRRLENLLLSEVAVWLIGNRRTEADMPGDLIMEVSAGVGGQEAMLFTKEIFDMYRRYAQFRQWEFNVIEEQTTDLNGLHFAAASISGADAYARLRFEAGVHRVQRVPATERTGRVHTSTMSVAILAQPQSTSSDKINMKEFRFETFRPCAPGGQNVNKSDAGSRITHLPTGIVVSCQMERSGLINRDLAFRRLLAILYERKADSQRSIIERSRKLQVGSSARSEKIRTYNYPQDRITDHRTKQSFVGIPDALAGGDGLEQIVHSMLRFCVEERLMEALEEEEKEFSKSQRLKETA